MPGSRGLKEGGEPLRVSGQADSANFYFKASQGPSFFCNPARGGEEGERPEEAPGAVSFCHLLWESCLRRAVERAAAALGGLRV